MGKSAYETKLSPTDKKRLLTDWEWGDDQYGKDIVRNRIVSACDCVGKLQRVETEGDQCVLCGHYAVSVDLDKTSKKL